MSGRRGSVPLTLRCVVFGDMYGLGTRVWRLRGCFVVGRNLVIVLVVSFIFFLELMTHAH